MPTATAIAMTTITAAAVAAAGTAKSVSHGAVSAKAGDGVRSVKARPGRSAAAASGDEG